MSDAAAEQALSALMAERGGPAKFDATATAIARKLALLLSAGDNNLSAATVETLLGLLPSKPAADARPYNLALLSKRELALLEHLLRRASGETKALPAKSRSELTCQKLG